MFVVVLGVTDEAHGEHSRFLEEYSHLDLPDDES
jgi:hypothetical protein